MVAERSENRLGPIFGARKLVAGAMDGCRVIFNLESVQRPLDYDLKFLIVDSSSVP